METVLAKTSGCVGKSSIPAYFWTTSLLSSDQCLTRYGGRKMMLLETILFSREQGCFSDFVTVFLEPVHLLDGNG